MLVTLKKYLWPVLALLGLLLMIAWMAGFFNKKIPAGSRTLPAVQGGEPVVVKAVQVTIIEKVPASIEATQATLISSRLLARIQTINVRSGDIVKEGDLLLELENSDIKAQVEQAESRVQATTARLTEAKQNLARVRELRAQGAMSVADLDKAQANHTALIAELAGATQALDEARTTLSYTRIVAPIDGRIVDRFAEPGDTAQPGSKLLALYNPLYMRVEAQVREHLALNLEIGQQLQVEIPSLEKVIDASVEERVPAADPGSRSFLVKAGVAFDKDLLPGLYARLLVPAGTQRQLLIPADRVVQLGQLNVVWVFRDGHSYRRFVRVGQVFENDQIEILSGLVQGEMVVPAPE